MPSREDGCLSLQSTRRRNEKHLSDPSSSGEWLCLRKALAFKEPEGEQRHTRQSLLCAQRLRLGVGAVHSCSGHARFALTMKSPSPPGLSHCMWELWKEVGGLEDPEEM